eukprot:g44690.t1
MPGSKRLIVTEDSRVRGADSHFCVRLRDVRMMCCLPGARIKDISEGVQNILKGEKDQQELIVRIETSEIGRDKDENLRREYGKLEEEVLIILKCIKVDKSPGPDQVCPRTLWKA